MTQPSDPFASPQVGPTPFATPTSSPVCPKCGWHQPDGARSCAACGLIFARYAEAERRRQARAPTVSPEAVEGARVDFAGLPTGPAGFVTAEPTGPLEIRVGEIIGSAASGASGALGPLIALLLLPFVIVLTISITAATVAPLIVTLHKFGGVAADVVVGVLVLLLALRGMGGIVAGTLIAVDDVMEGVEPRGVFATVGEGWARGVRALGVQTLMGLAMLVPAIPLALAIRGDAGTPVVLGLALVAAIGTAFIGLRLTLALPLAVLGQREAIESLGLSWGLTATAVAPIALSLLATTALSVAALGVLSMVAIIPVLGWFVAFVGQAVVAGFGMAVTAGLYRRLVPRAPRYT